MKSPARRHRERMTAAAASTSPAAASAASDQYQIMMAGLWQMRRDLKNIKSIERKIAYKRDQALPQLADYVAGVIASDTGEPNDVVTTAMIWRFDIGDLAGGLDIAEYAIGHGLVAPDQYERDTVTIVADEVADRALERLKTDPAPEGDELAALHGHIDYARHLIGERDIHDQVAAKLHKALGYADREAGHLPEALQQLKRALELNDKIGVKKDAERLESQIKRSEQESTKNSAGQGTQ